MIKLINFQLIKSINFQTIKNLIWVSNTLPYEIDKLRCSNLLYPTLLLCALPEYYLSYNTIQLCGFSVFQPPRKPLSSQQLIHTEILLNQCWILLICAHRLAIIKNPSKNLFILLQTNSKFNFQCYEEFTILISTVSDDLNVSKVSITRLIYCRQIPTSF